MVASTRTQLVEMGHESDPYRQAQAPPLHQYRMNLRRIPFQAVHAMYLAIIIITAAAKRMEWRDRSGCGAITR